MELNQSSQEKLSLGMVSVLTLASIFYFQTSIEATATAKDEKGVLGAKNTLVKKVEEDDFQIPYPGDIEVLNSGNSKDQVQTSFKTKKNAKEIQGFYKSVFYSKNWKLESEGSLEGFYVTKYIKSDKLATVVSSDDEENKETVANVEIVRR